jgi:hypothetical protein
VTHLDRARELLEAMRLRHDARIEKGELGEWQTELNEVYRILVYIVGPTSVAYPFRPDESDLTDTHL